MIFKWLHAVLKDGIFGTKIKSTIFLYLFSALISGLIGIPIGLKFGMEILLSISSIVIIFVVIMEFIFVYFYKPSQPRFFLLCFFKTSQNHARA